MFFRKSQPDGGKRKPKKKKKKNARPQRPQRRLDSTLQWRPPDPARQSPLPPQRGAPLSPTTQWLLEKMRRLKNIEDYVVLKDSFIVLYLSDPHHNLASAERAFYSAAQTCKRHLRRK